MDPIYRDMLADVAAMYYLQEKTQSEIAEALGVSRVKVYRLLKEARDGGVIEIIIHRSRPRNDKLEQDLCERFDLTDALVLDTRGMEQAEVWRGMGEIGARYVEKLLKDDATIAICLGRSTYEVVHAMRTDLHRQVRIAQALGSIPFAIQELDSGALARQLANKLGGEVLYLPSPMIADNAEAAAVLRRQPAIERTLAAAREGHLYPSELTDRIIGLTLEELRCIPTVVAVAFGMSKAEAILGALRTGVVDVLATDDSAAREILRMGETRTVRRRC
jgi:DNA-binding transcriptional regulator LsrR (DeoR family)